MAHSSRERSHESTYGPVVRRTWARVAPAWARRVARAVLEGFVVVPGKWRPVIRWVKCAEGGSDLGRTDGSGLLQSIRRHAHILDKGLQHPHCEPGHGLSHYGACERLMGDLPTQLADSPCAEWARSVLAAHRHLQQGAALERAAVPVSVPESVTADLDALMRTRRTVRNYRERRVPTAALQRIAKAADWAASSCNRQPIVIHATDDPGLAVRCLRCCKGGTGFSAYVPGFVAFCAEAPAYTLPLEWTTLVIDVALGVQNASLMAHSLGLSLAVLNWLNWTNEERELRRLLGIPQGRAIVVTAALGYPATVAPVPERKPTELVLNPRRDPHGP